MDEKLRATPYPKEGRVGLCMHTALAHTSATPHTMVLFKYTPRLQLDPSGMGRSVAEGDRTPPPLGRSGAGGARPPPRSGRRQAATRLPCILSPPARQKKDSTDRKKVFASLPLGVGVVCRPRHAQKPSISLSFLTNTTAVRARIACCHTRVAYRNLPAVPLNRSSATGTRGRSSAGAAASAPSPPRGKTRSCGCRRVHAEEANAACISESFHIVRKSANH